MLWYLWILIILLVLVCFQLLCCCELPPPPQPKPPKSRSFYFCPKSKLYNTTNRMHYQDFMAILMNQFDVVQIGAFSKVWLAKELKQPTFENGRSSIIVVSNKVTQLLIVFAMNSVCCFVCNLFLMIQVIQ